MKVEFKVLEKMPTKEFWKKFAKEAFLKKSIKEHKTKGGVDHEKNNCC